MAILNDEQDWRFGLRVKLLKKTVTNLSPCFLFPIHWLMSSLMYCSNILCQSFQNKPGQNKKGWRDPDSDRNMNIQASGQAVNEEYHSSEHRVLQNKPGQSKKGRSDPDSDRNTTIQASDLAVNEEHHSNEHHVDSPDEEVNLNLVCNL